MRVERRGDVVEIVVSDAPVRHVLEDNDAMELADMIYEQFGLEASSGQLSDEELSFCPLLRGRCQGSDCALWVEGQGIAPGCAIATIARHNVIASHFDMGQVGGVVTGDLPW